MPSITPKFISEMSYVDFMAHLGEVNRPPGGKESIRFLVQNTFLDRESHVLDIGCNTGYCTFEIATLTQCHVTGLDISKSMLQTAQNFGRAYYPQYFEDKIQFKEGDATDIPFADESFDLVVSGGSTAFLPDIPKAISEYSRVVRTWGFIGDINFFYKEPPPEYLLHQMNVLMDIHIQPWDINYWMEKYSQTNLEMYLVHQGEMHPVTRKEIESYCYYLVSQHGWDQAIQEVALDRLVNLMTLFNDNHQYLNYGVFIMRKRAFPERILF